MWGKKIYWKRGLEQSAKRTYLISAQKIPNFHLVYCMRMATQKSVERILTIFTCNAIKYRYVERKMFLLHVNWLFICFFFYPDVEYRNRSCYLRIVIHLIRTGCCYVEPFFFYFGLNTIFYVCLHKVLLFYKV